VTVLAAEAAPAAAGAGEGAAAGGGLSMLPLGGGQREGQPGGSSVAFAIAVLLIGFACIGLWLAFHRPENAETGGFPGLFGQMLQWVHAGEESPGAASTASSSDVIPGGGIIGGLAGDIPEGGLFSLLPPALQKKLVDIGAGTGLVQWLKEHI
jgi:hypothetical protein